MASSEPVTPDTELELDAFPLPPAHNVGPLKFPSIAVPVTPPKGLEQYQTKALPPLPPRFNEPNWGKRSSSLIPAPLSLNRPTTPQPTPSQAQSLAVQRPRTASEDMRISVLESEIMKMAWVEPTKSLGESTSSAAPSLTDASRDTSLDSRPDSFQQALPTIDEPVSPMFKRKHVPTPIITGISSATQPMVSPQPRSSTRKIMALTGSNPMLTHSPGLLSPTGHNSAFKIKKLFGIDTEIVESAQISPAPSFVSHPWGRPVSAPVSEPDSEHSYTRNLFDTRPSHEAWMGPSPTLPVLEIDGSLGFSAHNFKLPDAVLDTEPRRPTTLKFAGSHPVRDLYHFSVLKISGEKAQEDGTRTTVIEVGKSKKKPMVKSPAQYSFFPRKESFSARRRDSAAQGNRKLPPTPLVPKPNFVHGKHPIKTPFPGGNPPLTSEPTTAGLTAGLSTAGLSSTGLSTPGLPGGSAPHPTPMIEDDEFSDIGGVDDVYRSQPVSAFETDDDRKARSFLSEKRISALSHVFKRHTGTSKEDKRRSKDSFASVGSHSFFKPAPRNITSTPTRAVITTTIGTPERASSFTSNESAGWFSKAGSTTNTTPASASVTRFSNPFSSRSSTPLLGDRSENEDDGSGASMGYIDTTPMEKKRSSLKMKVHTPSSLHLPRSSSTRRSESPTSPGRMGVHKSGSRRDKSAERRRNSMKNKIRIIPEGEVVEAGVPKTVKTALDSKRSSKRLSAHSWR